MSTSTLPPGVLPPGGMPAAAQPMPDILPNRRARKGFIGYLMRHPTIAIGAKMIPAASGTRRKLGLKPRS